MGLCSQDKFVIIEELFIAKLIIENDFRYPLDVVRRHMQLAGAVPDGHKYSGVVSTLVTVYTENGIKGGLYRGLSINYLRVTPQIAVMFAVYELAKQVLNKKSTS